MPRIRWIEDDEAEGEIARLYELIRQRPRSPGRVADILRTMSHRPDFLTAIMEAADRLHFRDGALTIAQHEMIASYVSALNHCHY
jgi:hypothetical protein